MQNIPVHKKAFKCPYSRGFSGFLLAFASIKSPSSSPLFRGHIRGFWAPPISLATPYVVFAREIGLRP